MWTRDYKNKVIEILKTGQKRSSHEYYIHKNYSLSNLGKITKVMKTKDNCLFATKDSVLSIISDIHIAIGHKGERKTHKKILESYANIPRKIVLEFIKNCERCIEKSRKTVSKGIVVKPITAKDFHDRGQVSNVLP